MYARHPFRSVNAAVLLLAVGTGYGGGNVGPITAQISHSFHVSLSAVGLTVTFFFGAIAIVTIRAARYLRHLGGTRTFVVCGALAGVGNAVCAASPWFAGVLVGRVLAGLGAGLALVAGPVVAEEHGGPRLVGVFGAAITVAIALALAVGSALDQANVSWRFAFVISALVGVSLLLVLPARLRATIPGPAAQAHFLKLAVRSRNLWRLMLLFVHANGFTIVVSTWLLEYLVRTGGTPPWIAGILGFVLFGVTAVMRQVGGRLAGAKPALKRLAAGSPLLSAGGLAGLALDPRPLPAVIWVALMGVGLALPYALMYDGAQRLFPRSPSAAVALLQSGPNVVLMAVIPIVGAALDGGHGDVAFLVLAGFMALAALANATRAAVEEPAADSRTA